MKTTQHSSTDWLGDSPLSA